MAQRWSEKAVRSLFNGLGAYGLQWFRRNTGVPHDWPNAPLRSRSAIYNKIRREYGGGGLTRGIYTRHQLEVATGYNRHHLERARIALNQKWKRTGPRGAYLISEEQAEDIIAWLRKDYWVPGKRLYGCAWCATTKREHKGLGLCARCYYRYRRVCALHGIQPGPDAQLESIGRLESLDSQNAAAHAKFLERARVQLGRGVALEEFDVGWLAMLTVGGPYCEG